MEQDVIIRTVVMCGPTPKRFYDFDWAMAKQNSDEEGEEPTIPEKIFENIFSMLSFKDICNVRLTCTAWKKMSERIWSQWKLRTQTETKPVTKQSPPTNSYSTEIIQPSPVNDVATMKSVDPNVQSGKEEFKKKPETRLVKEKRPNKPEKVVPLKARETSSSKVHGNSTVAKISASPSPAAKTPSTLESRSSDKPISSKVTNSKEGTKLSTGSPKNVKETATVTSKSQLKQTTMSPKKRSELKEMKVEKKTVKVEGTPVTNLAKKKEDKIETQKQHVASKPQITTQKDFENLPDVRKSIVAQNSVEQDEALARKLQEEFDNEMSSADKVFPPSQKQTQKQTKTYIAVESTGKEAVSYLEDLITMREKYLRETDDESYAKQLQLEEELRLQKELEEKRKLEKADRKLAKRLARGDTDL